MASYDTLATNYANNKVAEYEKKLTASLLDPLKNQKLSDEAVLKEQYDKLISSLDYSGTKLQNQYNVGAESAYVNKTLAEEALKYKLNQLGLATSGSGITQYYDLQTAYGSDLATLGATLNEGLADIEQEKVGALHDYNAGLQQLASDYLDRELSIKGNIQNMVDSYRQEQYNNYYQSLQDQYDRYINSIGNTGLRDDGNVTPTEEEYKAGQRVLTKYYDDVMSAEQAAALNRYGALSTQDVNGLRYQPAGILGYGLLQGTNKKAKDYGIKTNTSGVDVSNQNVWKTNDGSLWIWNGSKMKYEDVTTKVLAKEKQQKQDTAFYTPIKNSKLNQKTQITVKVNGKNTNIRLNDLASGKYGVSNTKQYLKAIYDLPTNKLALLLSVTSRDAENIKKQIKTWL